MPDAWSIITPFVGIVFGGVVSFFVTSYWDRKKNRTAQDAKIAALELQIGVLGSQVLPISEVFRSMLIKQLTHYHTPILDALLKKLEDKTITEAEEVEMNAALKQRTLDMDAEISDSERDAAHMLPMLNRRIKEEEKERADPEPSPASSVQSVLVPAPASEAEKGR
jgi:hypothetical protein